MSRVLRAAPVIPNRSLIRWEYLVGAFFIVQTTGAYSLLDRMLYGEWSEKTGDTLTQLLNLLQFGASAALFSAGLRTSRRIGPSGVMALLLTAFLLLSSEWSVEPQATLRRAIIYGFFMLGTIGISRTLSGDEYIGLLGRFCTTAAVISLCLAVISPGSVLMPEGELRGLFSHKNVLGQVMAAGVLANLHGLRAYPRRPIRFLASLGICIVAVIASRSSTSLLVVACLCVTEIVMGLLRGGGAARIAGWCCIILAVPLIISIAVAPDLLLSALGKNPTLTGRTDLWPFVIDCISLKPVLGWGLGAFWLLTNPAAAEISGKLGWVVPQAHNGLLELLLEVGFAGTALFLAVMLRTMSVAIRCLSTSARDLAITCLLCCGGIVLVGMTEEVLVDPGQIAVGILLITGFCCEQTLRAPRQSNALRIRGAARHPSTGQI